MFDMMAGALPIAAGSRDIRKLSPAYVRQARTANLTHVHSEEMSNTIGLAEAHGVQSSLNKISFDPGTSSIP